MKINLERDVLPRLPDKRWVEKIRNYKSPVAREGGLYRYFSPAGDEHGTTCYLSGLTTIIKDVLLVDLPKTKKKKLDRARRPEDPRTRAERLTREAYQRTRPFASRHTHQDRLTGFMRGSLIHKQIEHAVLLDEENFLRLYPDGMHPWAFQLLQEILHHGWCPVASEFVVFDLALQAATAIDLICVDIRTGRLIFIEHKTGDGGGRFHSPSLKQAWAPGTPPFGWYAYDMTPAHRAQVQQGLGVIMAVRDLALHEVCQRCPTAAPASIKCATCQRHLCEACKRYDEPSHRTHWSPVVEPFDACVAHVHERSVDFEPVTHRFLANEGVELYNYLSDANRRAAIKAAKKRKYTNK